MKNRNLAGILLSSLVFSAGISGASVVVTNAMENPLMGYEVHGIGEKENEVAVVFTNENAGAISWTAPADLKNVQFLVVGGGGGGGGDNNSGDAHQGGGGGGGGGVITGVIKEIKTSSVISIVVGAGGDGGTAGENKSGTTKQRGAGIIGKASKIIIDTTAVVVANGGGRDRGAQSTSGYTNGNNGGEGASGGGGRPNKSGGNATQGSVVESYLLSYAKYGKKGGAGCTVANDEYGCGAAGGGGGATAVGGNGTKGDAYKGGDGGAGLASDITGTTVVYGSGGGGSSTWGSAGIGGDGAGDGVYAGDGKSALANRGGGGGGGSRTGDGGNGGSGIVVLRYTAHAHEWSEWVTNKVATCTESGIRTRKCALEDCTIGEFNEVIPSLGHNWGEWNVLREHDRATPGYREHTCGRCGTVESELFVTRPIRILSIGNSFSREMCDKNALPKAAALIGCPVDYAHLYRGGGSLSDVWTYREEEDEYELKWVFDSEFASDNHPFSGLTSKPKILDVIKAYDWDIITLQQASTQSFKPDTYNPSKSPYLNNIINLIKTHAPNAKIVWQMTWSYGRFAKMPAHGINYGGNVYRRDNMFNNILSAYKTHVKDVVWKTIPTGYAVQLYRYRLPVIEPEQDFTYRDYQHLNQENATTGNTGGEYLQVLTWCKALFGEMPSYEVYPPSEYSGAYNLSDEGEIKRLRECASDACDAAGYDYYGQGTVDFHWNVKFLNNDGSLISQQSITNGATAKVLKIFDDKSWSCKRRVRSSDKGVTTETVTMTSENISTNKVYDTLTFTAKEAITDLGPQVGNDDEYVSYDPEDAVNAARESKKVKYPSAPTLSGEAGAQTVDFGGVSAAVPSYYTASLDGNILSLRLNDAAKPVIKDEDDSKAFEIKDGKVRIHLTNVKNKLYYSIVSAQTPDAEDESWQPCGEYEAGRSDFDFEADGETRFYKASVKDEL